MCMQGARQPQGPPYAPTPGSSARGTLEYESVFSNGGAGPAGLWSSRLPNRSPQPAGRDYLTWTPIAGPEGAIGKQKLSLMPPPPPVLGSVTPCPPIRLRRVFCLCALVFVPFKSILLVCFK